MNTRPDKSAGIFWFDQIGLADLSDVGGKNAGLGEMIKGMADSGVRVPVGFAVGARIYRDFIAENSLEGPIELELAAVRDSKKTLSEAGLAIRTAIMNGRLGASHVATIQRAYKALCERVGVANVDVAVRSSATAEDLPEASFAGQQESYLNICGAGAVVAACQQCFASLYTDRAIAYREENNFAHQSLALSVGVQQMVHSNESCAGVMFTLDPETGFPDVVYISGSWGLGETVVKGSVIPDRYMVFKPFLSRSELAPVIERSCGSKLLKMIYTKADNHTDSMAVRTDTVETSEVERHSLVLSEAETLQLANWAVMIERHHQRPMDIEWAKDGPSGELYIVQARPETIESQKRAAVLETFRLKETSAVLAKGISVGHAIASGPVCYLRDPSDSERFPEGAVLVTQRTDPDWVPVMRKAAGVITDTGGSTSHAAIVSRELKVPAIVGVGNATEILEDGMDVTLDCTAGSLAKVYSGCLEYETTEIDLDDIPATKTDLMINAAMPEGALQWWRLPTAGIGLTRIEFIISSQIRIHPMALLHPERVKDKRVLESIRRQTTSHESMPGYFVDRLSLGVAKIAASQYPKPVIVRMSDFKSNEYRSLAGGEFFEIVEQNPMLGLRGASRYYHPLYRSAFQLECRAIKRVRDDIGFDNVVVMIPFCRTPREADLVLATMAEAGLKRGVDGLQVYVMCEIPSNIILAEQFASRFDGFSIGSNDLTQLVLGIDRDSAELSDLFDTQDESIKRFIGQLIMVAHENGCKVGICGQAPSDHPEFAEFLVDFGIDSISLNPDSFIATARHISAVERSM